MERRGSYPKILGDESTKQNVQAFRKVSFPRRPVNIAHILNRWYTVA